MANKKVLERDISNRTVVVMLVVVIVVSVLSLGVYLNALDSSQPEVASSTQGTVGLTITKPSGAQVQASADGNVGLMIIPSEQ